uniref:E2F transcription factor CC-MB domain-containing protein n=1 Tax=Gasterosteus aculeatus aculeatus TaxID=481459 RepID=A0AAQ4RAA5_GASAC
MTTSATVLAVSDTLLAIQAPCGTKLDVPIPKAVRNCPTKYQIYLKSINGPIDVVLLNKLTVDSVPVVLPVPPSKELLRKAKSAVATSDETESSIKRAAKSRRTVMEDMLHLQSSSRSNTAPNRTDASECEHLSFSPLHRSPLPSEQEHIHTLDESEGILDIPMLNV